MIISKNAISLLVLALSMVGVNVSEEGLIEVISAAGTIISFAILVWHQLQREETTLFFWKKKE